MRLLLAALALLAADLLLTVWHPPGEAAAGTALRLDLAGLARHSELIVEARVLSARPVEVDGLLATEFLLEVARTFKGTDETYRAVRLPGGVRADGSGLLIPGMPRVLAGEEAWLFLGPESANGLRMPTGLAQGKLGIRRLPGGGRRLVGDLSGVELIGSSRSDRGGRGFFDYAECLAALEVALPREHQPVGIRVGQRPQDHRVRHAEDRDRSTDPQREPGARGLGRERHPSDHF